MGYGGSHMSVGRLAIPPRLHGACVPNQARNDSQGLCAGCPHPTLGYAHRDESLGSAKENL
jgi:hypothetical protein